MKQLVCDSCRQPIWNTQIYYKIQQIANNNDMFRNTEKDICSKCARELTVEKGGKE